MKVVKKSVMLLLAAVCLFAFCMLGCGKINAKTGSASVAVLEKSETLIVIETSDVKGDYTLADCLKALKTANEIDYTISGTMLVSVNDKSNDDDTFSYWMIYTTDEKSANEAWGTLTWQNTTLKSATKGVTELSVKDGCVYALAYQTMSF